MVETAMFPLGSVLFPTMVLPLHVFEPRYRTMTIDCLAGTREFGVPLIERGHEVGGLDVRTDLGCIAQIVEAQAQEDGRWLLGCVGTRRVRIDTWLPDDPYPRAEVSDWPDPPAEAGCDELRTEANTKLRQLLALALELGASVPSLTVEVADDPLLASYQLSALAPVGPLDKQALLGAEGATDRLRRLIAMIDEQQLLLEAQL